CPSLLDCTSAQCVARPAPRRQPAWRSLQQAAAERRPCSTQRTAQRSPRSWGGLGDVLSRRGIDAARTGVRARRLPERVEHRMCAASVRPKTSPSPPHDRHNASSRAAIVQSRPATATTPQAARPPRKAALQPCRTATVEREPNLCYALL